MCTKCILECFSTCMKVDFTIQSSLILWLQQYVLCLFAGLSGLQTSNPSVSFPGHRLWLDRRPARGHYRQSQAAVQRQSDQTAMLHAALLPFRLLCPVLVPEAEVMERPSWTGFFTATASPPSSLQCWRMSKRGQQDDEICFFSLSHFYRYPCVWVFHRETLKSSQMMWFDTVPKTVKDLINDNVK